MRVVSGVLFVIDCCSFGCCSLVVGDCCFSVFVCHLMFVDWCLLVAVCVFVLRVVC